MKHLELFAGIGGFRRAIDLVGHDCHIPIKCIGFSEIDSKAVQTYCTNYDTSNEIEIGDIVAFTSDRKNIDNLPDFDLLTGGFPCQTFSMMGGQAGFNEDRGLMFFRIMDIINEKHPKYVLLENVKNLVTHDRGNTIKRILKELKNADYIVHYDVFNTNDYGLPQTRNRTIIFARRKDQGDFEFTASKVKDFFDKNIHAIKSLSFYQSTIDILSKKAEGKYYLSERIKPTILSDGSAGFKSNSEIDKVVARPLTASMHKMHRACQDNYFSDIYINSNGEQRPSTWMTKEELKELAIRKLTPQEAFMLQGFPEVFATNAQKNKVADGALYKQAGNAVSVNTIYAILFYLIKNNIIVNCEHS